VVTVGGVGVGGVVPAVGVRWASAIGGVDYADRRTAEGTGPMLACFEAADRVFWSIVSCTARSLCAFLRMLFWPGVPGEFMGMLPVTLIFVLSASLVVALIYLPGMGGVTGRLARALGLTSDALKRRLPWIIRAALVPPSMYLIFIGAMQTLNPAYLIPDAAPGLAGTLLGGALFIGGAFATSITLGAARIERRRKRIAGGYRRTGFGYVMKFITGNPIMPVVSILAVIGFVVITFFNYHANNNGVEFFVETEPEQAIVYVRARGNMSLDEKDALVKQVEEIILAERGIRSAFAFAGAGGLNANTGGDGGPRDAIGQVQIEMIPWEERGNDPELSGKVVMERLQTELDRIPGIYTEVTELAQGPAQGKPVHLRLTGDSFDALQDAIAIARARFETTPALIDVEDTLPLPGIDWQIDVDVEKAGRYGADVATVGAMVQLVTRGILLDTMRVPTSDEEIEIRVRLPDEDRVLSTLDVLKVRTADGLVPLSNFITRQPVPKLGRIDRVDAERYYDLKADVAPGLTKLVNARGDVVDIVEAALLEDPGSDASLRVASEDLATVAINPTERIAQLTDWLETESPLPAGITWEWTGDQEEQAESGQFLMQAFAGALFLMFIILLAQFNSFYNAVLVLLAVVLSTAGTLWGMLIMDQPFSIIMTGTGIVALAGIVVNNNIVLIDTYQEFSRYMPRIEAIIRTAEQRIRPVLLTTITTMAGLAPMMFGLSLDFIGGGYSIDSPTALWWKQLATAVVFGLGIATVLTLIFTPSMLALRVWASEGSYRVLRGAQAAVARQSKVGRDVALLRKARQLGQPDLVWDLTPAQRLAPPAAQLAAPAQAISPPQAANTPGALGPSGAAATTHRATPLDRSVPSHPVEAAE